jgi:hypothetical protein
MELAFGLLLKLGLRDPCPMLGVMVFGESQTYVPYSCRFAVAGK